jgi:predicted HTH domain antitoxin
MANAMLNIRIVQPRMVSLRQAADYVGLPLKRFPRLCSVRPIEMPESEKRYDVRDLDKWLDQLKVGDNDTDADILERLL